MSFEPFTNFVGELLCSCFHHFNQCELLAVAPLQDQGSHQDPPGKYLLLREVQYRENVFQLQAPIVDHGVGVPVSLEHRAE